MDRIRKERRTGRAVCLLSAGEVTVSVSGKAGTGGRNQQWVLEVARLLQSESEDYIFLSAGSDGVDGNSPAAGAVAETQTWNRAERMGLDPAQALMHFDTYPLFEQLQDTIVTGPLGKQPPRSPRPAERLVSLPTVTPGRVETRVQTVGSNQRSTRRRMQQDPPPQKRKAPASATTTVPDRGAREFV